MKKKISTKAQTVTIFLVIIGILFVAALIVMGSSFISKLFRTFDNTKTSFSELTDAIVDVAENYEVGTGKRVLLRFDESSGIVAFNPRKDFFYYVPQDQSFGHEGVNVYGRFMKRPSSCEENSFCICSCDEFFYTDMSTAVVEKFTYNFGCETVKCRNLKNVEVPEKIIMKDVFDYEDKLKFRDSHYWDNSFIMGVFDSKNIWRRDTIKILTADRAIFAGYYEGTYEYAALFIKKVSVSPPMISICFKDDCFKDYSGSEEQEIKCPYTRCNQIRDSIECDSPENIPGCENLGLDCTYDYSSSKCVAR